MNPRNHRLAALLSSRRKGRGQRGMSLVEIMIVLAIISMIMGAAAFGGFAQLEKAKVKETKNMMRLIEQAVVQWQTETNETCPSNLTDLSAKKILNKEPKDGWNQPFIFKCPGDHGNEIDLTSKGKDRKENTEDDIHSWDDDSGTKKGG